MAGQVDRTSRKLQDLANRRDKIREKIAEARQFATSQTESTADFMDLGEGKNAKALIGDLKKQQADVQQFQKDITYLRQRGLNKDLLAQVIEEGPGGDLAKRIMTASSAEFKQLNDLAKKGAGLAKSVGRLTADAMYDSGKQASKGFLAGLIAEEKRLQKEMNKLGESLIRAIKKALKIKSPSQRARDEVGRMFGRGVVRGVDDSLVDVRASGARLSAAMISSAYTRPTGGMATGGATEVRVFIGDQEIRDIVRVETRPLIRDSEQRQAYRAKVGRR